MSILLGSKLRRKLLAYSFTHSNESYYVRELASIIDEDAGNLSRELKKLEEEGLYKSHSKGKVKFYSLCKGYPLYDELKRIVFKTEGVEGILKRLVSKYKGISLAFVYGSYAYNKVRKMSDIDLIVVGTFPQNKFMHDICAIESKLNREINYTAYTKKEFSKERYKEGGFLNIVLKEKVLALKGNLHD